MELSDFFRIYAPRECYKLHFRSFNIYKELL